MGAPGIAAPASPDATDRSVAYQFVTRVVIPVAALVLVWAALTGAALGHALGRPHWLAAMSPRHQALTEAAIVAGAGLVIVVIALILTCAFAMRLSRELTSLAASARLASLAGLAENAGAGENTGPMRNAGMAGQPVPATTTAETRAVAAAVVSMRASVVTSTAGQAGLRHGLRQILVSLGRRNQSLVHRQLRIIDALEQEATSSAELSSLFTLDHLTTRMRRHAESLSILAGEAPGRSWSAPVPVLDVMRAAAAEIEDYKRVSVVSEAEEGIAAPAVTDMIHLLAELIENATLFSPSSTRVEVRAESVANGFVVEVEDKGLGIPADQLREINERLASPPDIHLADADRLGLFVAGRLAARHGIQVSLTPSAYRGTKAVVVLPTSIVVSADAVAAQATAPGAGPAGTSEGGAMLGGVSGAGRLNLRSPEVLAMAGAVTSGQSTSAPSVPGSPFSPFSPFSAGAAPRSATAGSVVPSTTRSGSPAANPLADTNRSASTLRRLPRRVRPGADGDSTPTGTRPTLGPVPRQAPPDSPAPEAARSLAASLQDSWKRSQETGPVPPAPDDEEET